MRHLHRVPLDWETRKKLLKKSALCTDTTAARREWKNYRASAAGKPVIQALKHMTGASGRCFYCGDSRGADVDHFVPIDSDHCQTFTWANLQLACSPCNRNKSSSPTIVDGARVIIDPCRDDPWEHLVLVLETGIVVARTNVDGSLDPIGKETLRRIENLNVEAVTERRRQSIRRIAAAAERAVNEGDSIPNRRDLLWAASDDTFGVSAWFVLREGRSEPQFLALRDTQKQLWRRFARAASQA